MTRIRQMIDILESLKRMPKAAAKAMVEMACDLYGKDYVTNVMWDFGYTKYLKWAR